MDVDPVVPMTMAELLGFYTVVWVMVPGGLGLSDRQ